MIRRSASLAAILVLTAGLPAFAQSDKPGALPAPTIAPPAKAKPATDAKGALADAKTALSKINWIEYSAKVEGQGVNGDLTSTVALEKAAIGTWKIAVRGELKGKGSAKGRPIVLGYDGVNAWAIRDAEKQVGQISGPVSIADLTSFFAKEKAASFVAWPLIETAMYEFKGADLKLEPTVEVDGEKCNVVRAAVPSEKASDNTEPVSGVYYFAISDGLLRKVERFRPNAKPGDKPARTTTFTNVKAEKIARGGEFTLRIPEGYKVKPESAGGGGKESSASAEKARTRIKNPAKGGPLTTGAQITPFSGDLMGGSYVNFPSDYKGKVVLIDFWATWCGPCVAELPNVVETYKTYKDQGFEILGITLDNKGADSKIKAMEDKLGMTWPQVYDGGGWKAEIPVMFGINSIPRAVLVDGDTGKIIDGGQNLRGEALGKTVEAALKKKSGK